MIFDVFALFVWEVFSPALLETIGLFFVAAVLAFVVGGAAATVFSLFVAQE